MNPVRFDAQASEYEARAGLPDAIGSEIAAHLVASCGPRAVVLDVGAGTGTIGRHLAASGVRYVALDRSRPMLEEFPRSSALLLQADADDPWPLAERSVDVMLLSRAGHLLKRERTLAEVCRVAAPAARVFSGRVRRVPESAGELLKKRVQHLLRERDIPGRNGERAQRDFLAALEQRGARILEPWHSQRWSVRESPMESLIHWRSKEGLGGRVVSNDVKTEILGEVERWAASELGDLETPREVFRHYELQGAEVVG